MGDLCNTNVCDLLDGLPARIAALIIILGIVALNDLCSCCQEDVALGVNRHVPPVMKSCTESGFDTQAMHSLSTDGNTSNSNI
jgi:hypothetical protein